MTIKNNTKIRKGYKQTEVGVIPEDWEAVMIGDLFDFKNGLNKAKDFFGRGTPIVNYMDVFNCPGLWRKDVGGKVSVTPDEIRNYHVKKGDLFFTRTSETVDEIGMSAVMLQDIDNAVFSGFVLRGRPKTDALSLPYKRYCFRSLEVRKQIISTSSYTTRALTNGRLLSKVFIPIPPTKIEQNGIGDALSSVDALIESLDKLIAKKRLIKQGSMQELLKPKEGWRAKNLGEIAIVQTGSTPPTNDRSNYGEDFLFVGPADLGGRVYIQETEKGLSRKGFEMSRAFPQGSVLFTCIGSTIGKTGIASKELTSNQQINAVFPSNKLHSEFAYYLLTYLSPKIKALAGEQAVPQINKSQFENTQLLIPQFDIQTAIATILSDMDAEISALGTKLAKYKQIKQGMMQNLLTGRIRLV